MKSTADKHFSRMHFSIFKFKGTIVYSQPKLKIYIEKEYDSFR